MLTSFGGSITRSIPSRFFYLGCSICSKIRLLVSCHRSTHHPQLEPFSPPSLCILIERLWGQYRLVSLNPEVLNPLLQRTGVGRAWITLVGCHASPHPEVSSPSSSVWAPSPKLREALYESQKRVTVSSLPLSGGFTLYQFTDTLIKFWENS